MKVKVVPKRPIPGILPKNKWIDTEMELDLNKNEVAFCMRFGNVYDINGSLIDTISLQNVPTTIASVKESIKEIDINTAPIQELIDKEVELGYVETEITDLTVDKPEEEKEHTELSIKSITSEYGFIIVESILNSNVELTGELYGLLNIISGQKPVSIEYKLKDTWKRFGTKFDNFDVLNNGDIFVFRFVSNTDKKFTFKLSIKKSANELAKLEYTVDPENL